jgi:hypothetical protein
VTPSISISATPSVTPSISISKTPSVTPSISISATPSITPSISISKTPSVTPSISISKTPSVTPSRTPSTSVPSVTTLQYSVTDYITGTITVNNNGFAVDTLTSDISLQSVTISAGSTVQMLYTGGTKFTTYIYYYLNGTLQATYSGGASFSSALITTSAGNTYKFEYFGSA